MLACVNGGYRWFETPGGDEQTRCESVAAARSDFDEMLTRLVTTSDFHRRLDRVALVGFSQGATMALDAFVSGRWPVAAIVGFAGRFSSPEPLRPTAGATVSIIHGDDDPVVPEAEGQRAAVVLRRHGVRVERHIVSSEAHGITREAAEIAAAFLFKMLEEEHRPAVALP